MNEWLWTIVTAVAVVLVISLIYRIRPYRELPDRKPHIAVLPKYQAKLNLAGMTVDELESRLNKCGYQKNKESDNAIVFSRGSVTGDLSVEALKSKFTVAKPFAESTQATLEAAWMVAFDTGDFFRLFGELKERIET
jgi:hypothetical protein